MKPKTKLQMEIVNGSRKLAPVSEAQKRYAYKHCFVHYFKRDAKGNCFCLDCGHTWRDKEDKKNCKCPHCGMNLKLENSRKRTAIYKEYFCVITTYKQYQVIRFFMVDCRLKKGSPANYFIIEAVQCWMNKEGKTETLSLLRGMSIFYYDAWIYGSSLELRKRNVHHDRIYDICPAVIYPRMKVIPELTRNGFKGVFYDICPSSFFMTLLTDNRMEILYKAGQMNLFLRFLERKYGMDSKYSINSLVYWVTYVHNVVYSFYRSMIYCYINSTQRCAGSIVIDIIPTNGADKRKFFPFAPYFPVTNVIKRYFYPYFPAIIGIKGYSFPYFPYLSGIMKIKTALYSLFSRLDWHKTVVFPCLGEIYEGIRSLSWEIPVT